MNEFKIAFYGLKEGKHEFKFDINHSFFEAFENALVDNGKIEVILDLEKFSNMLILNLDAKGTVETMCDLCGDPLDLSLSATEKIIVKFGEEQFDQTDEIIIIPHDTHEIDISQRVYELIVLSLPNKRQHENIEDCNQEVIQKMEELQMRRQEEKKNIDPRWDALNKLKN
jgi:uncharacterized metal-binding protein YceD (DUF177 family)